MWLSRSTGHLKSLVILSKVNIVIRKGFLLQASRFLLIRPHIDSSIEKTVSIIVELRSQRRCCQPLPCSLTSKAAVTTLWPAFRASMRSSSVASSPTSLMRSSCLVFSWDSSQANGQVDVGRRQAVGAGMHPKTITGTRLLGLRQVKVPAEGGAARGGCYCLRLAAT